MIDRIAIEGIDGSGKSTTCHELVHQLDEDGLRAVVFAPFRLANEQLGHDIYDLWATAPEEGVKILKGVIEKCEVEAETNGADVVIYDRHWITALESLQDCEVGEALWQQHGPGFVRVALLRVPIETALNRRADELEDPWMQGDALGRTAECYNNLAKKHGKQILGVYRSDDDVTPAQVASNIIWDMRIRR